MFFFWLKKISFFSNDFFRIYFCRHSDKLCFPYWRPPWNPSVPYCRDVEVWRVLNLAPMMPRNAGFSDGCTSSDHCSNSSLYCTRIRIMSQKGRVLSGHWDHSKLTHIKVLDEYDFLSLSKYLWKCGFSYAGTLYGVPFVVRIFCHCKKPIHFFFAAWQLWKVGPNLNSAKCQWQNNL